MASTDGPVELRASSSGPIELRASSGSPTKLRATSGGPTELMASSGGLAELRAVVEEERGGKSELRSLSWSIAWSLPFKREEGGVEIARVVGSFVAVRLRSFDDFPSLSDRKSLHFDRKLERELAGCEGSELNCCSNPATNRSCISHGRCRSASHIRFTHCGIIITDGRRREEFAYRNGADS
ncbi:hypothetical protein KFK09_001219 [Dendrobium nobile]|uniref:Uncharacterized protein n=1 Tax=Dendrobium nobile TaxID=94219 RepID=A0A8T3C6N2_DENNO|nr:hypothetical protein KFK09_001219 [Dendrobium nobile]